MSRPALQADRAQVLAALRRGIRDLLVSEGWADAAARLLGDLAVAQGADRALIHELGPASNASMGTRLRIDWHAGGAASPTPNAPWIDLGALDHGSDWFDRIVHGHGVAIEVVPGDQVARAVDPSAVALIAVPLVVESRVWGLVTLTKHGATSDWSVFDVTALGLAAAMVGVAIQRTTSDPGPSGPEVRVVALADPVADIAARIAAQYADLLAAVVGFTDRAAQRLKPKDPAHADLRAARRAVLEAQDFTEQILAVGRSARLAPQILDVNEFVEEVADVLRNALSPDVVLDVDLGHGGCRAFLDAPMLVSALLRLATNGIDAIGQEGRIGLRTSTVRPRDVPATWSIPGADRLVVIEVSDTGPGIGPADQARIWEPFQTTKPGRRAGLGLAIVRGFVEQSGGRIDLDLTPGGGTTARMIVPGAPPTAVRSEVRAR